MSGKTKHYSLVKPTVGGSENEWGGNLNDDLDDIDALLGGDEPVYGINIQPNPNTGPDDNETSIDGSVITGEIGNGDPDNPTTINPETVISGKVKKLVGLDDPDGKITNCDVSTRKLEIGESITENVVSVGTSNKVTFNAADGTMHYLTALNDNQEITLIIGGGQSMTLMMGWGAGSAPSSIVWKISGSTAPILWVGGGSPDIVDGINIVQIWAIDGPMGKQVFGAGAGAAS